ncbi:MAG: inositol monophosphatase family protein [Vicinamibacterales bacterium]
MTPQDLGRDAVAAMAAVADAVHVARAVEREAAIGALVKDDASPVTIADFSVQALVAARLSRDCPNDPLVAEEDASALRAPDEARLSARVVDFVQRVEPDARLDRVLDWIDRGGGAPGRRFWTLDPIDGTKGLLRGGQYVIALALIVDGTVELGVVGCPRLTLDTMPGRAAPFSAAERAAGGIAVGVRHQGSWWASSDDGLLVRLSVSTVADPGRARVLHSVEGTHSDAARCDRVLRTLGVDPPPLLMDSQAKHVVLASGQADLLLRLPQSRGFHDTIWDQAAGSLLIAEAGGRVTDVHGRALDFSAGRRLLRNDGLVASNGLLHDAVLAALGAVSS